MSSDYASKGDKKTFILFLLLSVFTAAHFVVIPTSPMIAGFLSILWGGLGLFRLIYLTHYQMDEVPKMLELPVQILFGIGKQEQERRKNIVRRLTRPDFVLWLAGAILLVIWTMINGLYPNPAYIVEAFSSIKKLDGLTLALPDGVNAYSILTGLSFYGAMVSVIFMAVTFSYNRTYTKACIIVFAPLILLGAVMVFISGQYADPLLWPDLSHFKGAGLRTGQTEFLITTFGIESAASAFTHRFLMLGSVGAYGIYLIGFPAVVMFVRTVIKAGRDVFKPLMGLLALILLVVLDLFIILSAWTLFLSFALMVFAAILWGYTIRYK